VLDAPQRPAESSEGYKLLFFSSLQTLLIATQATA
jgi:hypothetical protein